MSTSKLNDTSLKYYERYSNVYEWEDLYVDLRKDGIWMSVILLTELEAAEAVASRSIVLILSTILVC